MRLNTQAFYWRSPLFPERYRARCHNYFIPQKPTQIPIEAITIEINIFEDTINIIVNWGPPQYTNGNLTLYEVCLSENGLGGEEDCDENSLFDVPPDVLTFKLFQFIQVTQLAVQVYTYM